ncbi:MAG: tetratricopeptide repeat protein, partial [Candidatus Delongbacteria bacterium]|nr:tetratricopeptide repeat protein [Candidatus Delongbacteria bacterium]
MGRLSGYSGFGLPPFNSRPQPETRESVIVIQRVRYRILLLLFLLLPCATLSAFTSADSTRFQEELHSYYRGEISRFNFELSLKETVLLGRLRSVNRELRQRGEFIPPAGFFDSSADSYVVREHFSEEMINSINLPRRVEVWMQQQRRILEAKSLKIDNLKFLLIDSASNDQLLRMFRFDLELAAYTYARGDFELSILQFEDIIRYYNYVNLDDVYFLLADANYAALRYETARGIYLFLLRDFPDNPWLGTLIDHLLYTWFSFGDYQAIIDFYTDHGAIIHALPEEWRYEVQYMTGVSYFHTGDFAQAMELLVQTGGDYALRSHHLMATCSIFLDETEQARMLLNELGSIKIRRRHTGLDSYIRDDANIKLGYLQFEQGKFQEASAAFDRVSTDSPLADNAILGRAWADINVRDYESAMEYARQLIEFYPGSRFIFEAYVLVGHAYELFDLQEKSVPYYSHVLEEGERFNRIQESTGERRRIVSELKNLRQLEAEVFAEEDLAGYHDYLAINEQLNTLYRRVRYLLLMEANEVMREYIVERAAIQKLQQELLTVTDPALLSQDPEIVAMVAELRRTSRLLDKRIKLSGMMEINKNPIIQLENETAYRESIFDGVRSAVAEEQQLLAATLAESEQLVARSQDSADLADQINSQVTQGVLTDLQDVLDRYQTRLHVDRREPISSDINRWSDVSFSRLALGNIQFDQLMDMDV